MGPLRIFIFHLGDAIGRTDRIFNRPRGVFGMHNKNLLYYLYDSFCEIFMEDKKKSVPHRFTVIATFLQYKFYII